MHPGRLLASGFLLGAGAVLIAVGLLLAHYAAEVHASSWAGSIEKYSSLLSEASKVLERLRRSGIVGAYKGFVEELPELRGAVAEYRSVYQEAIANKELVIGLYNVTHSQAYNETLARLEREARAGGIIGLVAGPLLEQLAGYMKEAQRLSAEAVKLLRLIEELPPQKLEEYLSAAENLSRTIPPEKLGSYLSQAQSLVAEAQRELRSLNESGVLHTASHARSYGYYIAAAGVLAASAGAALAVASWPRRAREGS